MNSRLYLRAVDPDWNDVVYISSLVSFRPGDNSELCMETCFACRCDQRLVVDEAVRRMQLQALHFTRRSSTLTKYDHTVDADRGILI